MRGVICASLLFLALFSCSRVDTVQISGRIENGDSIVNIWVNDSIYTFPLNENDYFSGKIALKRACYATLLYNSLNLYLNPGEDLEIYMDANDFSSSLYFRGSLGAINTYLKEQEVAIFFDQEYYALPENEFVHKMEKLIDEKVKLLEAKNFERSFTMLEKERIRYSIAEYVVFYPVIQKQITKNANYSPGRTFTDFLASFSLNDENLYGINSYRMFLLNYSYLQGMRKGGPIGNYSVNVANYILSTVTNQTIKNFLLTELVYRHIRENNGLNDADNLLAIFRRECTDKSKVAYVNELVSYWEKLLPGKPAPDFHVLDINGNKIGLKEYRGSYLYIMVWATWCKPCKGELPYINLLQREYADKNISFLTISIDGSSGQNQWKTFIQQNRYAGIHTILDKDEKFSENYMIISIPRFIFIDLNGNIIHSNAPRPSGQIRPLFDSCIYGVIY